MADIKLLDCTLRDGGYVNDWQWGFGLGAPHHPDADPRGRGHRRGRLSAQCGRLRPRRDGLQHD